MLSEPPWLALFLSLIGHSKQLKQLCTYLIGWGLYSYLSWLGGCSQMWNKFRFGLVLDQFAWGLLDTKFGGHEKRILRLFQINIHFKLIAMFCSSDFSSKVYLVKILQTNTNFTLTFTPVIFILTSQPLKVKDLADFESRSKNCHHLR